LWGFFPRFRWICSYVGFGKGTLDEGAGNFGLDGTFDDDSNFGGCDDTLNNGGIFGSDNSTLDNCVPPPCALLAPLTTNDPWMLLATSLDTFSVFTELLAKVFSLETSCIKLEIIQEEVYDNFYLNTEYQHLHESSLDNLWFFFKEPMDSFPPAKSSWKLDNLGEVSVEIWEHIEIIHYTFPNMGNGQACIVRQTYYTYYQGLLGDFITALKGYNGHIEVNIYNPEKD
jgi:hypothetical protein